MDKVVEIGSKKIKLTFEEAKHLAKQLEKIVGEDIKNLEPSLSKLRDDADKLLTGGLDKDAQMDVMRGLKSQAQHLIDATKAMDVSIAVAKKTKKHLKKAAEEIALKAQKFEETVLGYYERVL